MPQIYKFTNIFGHSVECLTLIPLGYLKDLSPWGGGGGPLGPPPPQISATQEPIDLKLGTDIKQVEKNKNQKEK